MLRSTEKGLTGFELKYLALVFMVLDHIHYFFEFTGKIPVIFSMAGRLAAPLFLFCFVEGFIHTRNRKAYFLRIYLISVIMGAVRFGFYNILSSAVRRDGFFPENAMLSSFAILFVVMQGIDMIRRKKIVPGLAAVIIPLIMPVLMQYCIIIPCMTNDNRTGLFLANLLAFTVLPIHSWISDGGTMIILQGMVLLIFSYCKNKKIRICAWAAFTLLWNTVGLILAGIPLDVNTLFFQAYEWMEVFALAPMLCYNGERGKGTQRFFYLFYPAHIYILYGLSVLLYNTVIQ